jgi:hypothetical protein
MASNRSKSPGKKKPKPLSAGTLMLAVMFLWSAQHEPLVFNIVSLATWILGAVSTALLARAVLALAVPVLALAGSILRHAFQGLQGRAEQ